MRDVVGHLRWWRTCAKMQMNQSLPQVLEHTRQPTVNAAIDRSRRGRVATVNGVVCFAGVDWWYHNRGHSECQIMKRLGARMPVLWVNSIGMRLPSSGKTELPLRRYLRKLRSTLKFLRRDASGMWVYSPLFVPIYKPWAFKLNGILLALQIKPICTWIRLRKPAVFITVPTAAMAAERVAKGKMVFNRSDEFSAFREADADAIRPLELRLLSRSDTVIYVNRGLLEREQSLTRDARYLGHGVDWTHFAVERENTIAPDAIKSLPKPIVGFYGALDDYTVDLELMIKVARHLKQGTLLVIGPKAMDISRLEAEPNVRYLGPIPYADLPTYAAHFDVALMPWLQNEWIAACNPIKLKEYLAMGFPVVTTKFAELKPYEHLVYPAATHEQFLAGVDCALVENDPAQREQRRQSVRADSWDAAADRVAEMLNLPPRRGGDQCAE